MSKTVEPQKEILAPRTPHGDTTAERTHPPGDRVPSRGEAEASLAVPVVTFGAGVTLLGVIRSFARAGIPVHVASAVQDFVTSSRWFQPTPETLPESSDAGRLGAFLQRLPFRRAVLVPCSDAWSSAISNLPPALAARFPSSMAKPDVQEILLDKGGFRRALDRFGLPHPRTLEIHAAADLERVPEADFAGTFLKPRDSQRFFARFGVKAFECQDKSRALELWRDAERAGHAMLLQEYVPGPPNHHCFVDGFIDRDVRVRALFARRRVRMHPPDFGNSSCLVSVPLSEVAGAVDAVVTLLRGVRYRGIFSAEFKYDARDGLYKMLEVNARPWWYVGFAADCGVDVCRMAYDDALDRPVPEVSRYAVGRSCIFAQLDWVRCRELHETGELSYFEWIRSWARSAHPIFARDDPAPAAVNLSSLLPRLLRFRAATEDKPTVART